MTPTYMEVKARRRGANLLFSVGDDRYHLELSRLQEVVAWAALENAEERGVLGWLDLRGVMIPVVDLSDLIYKVPTKKCLGSRILILQCVSSRDCTRMIGALVSEVFSLGQGEREGDSERFDPCDVLSSILMGVA